LIPGSPAPQHDSQPPLQDGDADAVAVLAELLQSSQRDVRIIAANGLERVGPEARKAVPALLVALKDEHGLVGQSAWQALNAIDSTVAWPNSLPYLLRLVDLDE
jgi:HEAT repeat protein